MSANIKTWCCTITRDAQIDWTVDHDQQIVAKNGLIGEPHNLHALPYIQQYARRHISVPCIQQYARWHISVPYMTVAFCGGFGERIPRCVSVMGDPKRKKLSLLDQTSACRLSRL